MKELDVKDRRILYELDMSGRQSNAQIGKKVGLSDFAVGYRIQRMIERGVIKGFYTVIDTSRLGYCGFRVYLKLHGMSPKKEKEFIRFLVEQPSTFWVNTLHGQWDLSAHFWAKNVHEFHHLWLEAMKKYKPFIKDEQISQHLQVHHYRRAYLVEKEREATKPFIVGGSERIPLDKTDWKILRLISSDARKPLTEVAHEAGVSLMVARYRIKKMTDKKVILGVRPTIDLGLIGVEWHKINFYLRDVTRMDKMLEYVARHPNTVHVYQAIGLSDFEVGYEIKDLNQFYDVLADVRDRFSDSIDSYTYFRIYKEHKHQYMPMEMGRIS